MYFSLNNETFVVDFNPYPKVRISGPDLYYLVELNEFTNGNPNPKCLESYKVTPRPEVGWRTDFTIPIEFFLDFELNIYKIIDGQGIVRMYSHRFCDFGKLVRFNIETEIRDECNIYVERVLEYQKRHACRIHVNSKFDDINKNFENFYNADGVDYYKTYNLGKFPKNSDDFRTKDPRKENFIWYGMYKTFWSYQHPRNWHNLTIKEIADDILGL